MAKANRYVTDRGFVVYDELPDLNGNSFSIGQSSLATERAVWIFGANLHLDLDQAKRVRDALDAFIASHPTQGSEANHD